MTIQRDATEERLAALGMPGAQVGETERISVAPHPAGEGRSMLAVTDPAEAAEAGTFVPVDSPMLESGGVFLAMLDDWPDVLRVMCAQDNVIVDLRGFPWVAFDQDDAGVACCLATAPEPGVVITSRGTYLLDWRDRRIQAVSWPVTTAAVENVTSPVGEWARESIDGWLSEEIRVRLDHGGTWSAVVATGMFARLERLSEGRAREIVTNQLAGALDDRAARPWRWVRSLSLRQLEAIESLTLAETDILHRFMDDALRAVALDDPNWCEDIREICHRRDDVECAWRLLSEVGTGRRIRSLVAQLDATGDAFFAGLRGKLALEDERLKRVAREQPDAWWARVAVGDAP